MMNMTSNVRVVSLLVIAFLMLLTLASLGTGASVTTLSPQELYNGIRNNRFQAVVDVRTRAEWDDGHIANTTLLESLNRYNTSGQISTPDDISGCKNCSIAVYCRSGNRAGVAIVILQEAGFTGPLYNGLGTSQWIDAGYELVTDDSLDPTCQAQGTCCETACDQENGSGASNPPSPPNAPILENDTPSGASHIAFLSCGLPHYYHLLSLGALLPLSSEMYLW